MIQLLAETILYLSVAILIVLISQRHGVLVSKKVWSVVIIVLFCFAFSQAFQEHRYTYPFISWRMYAQTHPPQAFYEFIITLEDTQEEHYPFSEVSFSSPRAIMRKIEILVEECVATNNCAGADAFVEGLQDIYVQRRSQPFNRFQVNIVGFEEGSRIPLTKRSIYIWEGK